MLSHKNMLTMSILSSTLIGLLVLLLVGWKYYQIYQKYLHETASKNNPLVVSMPVKKSVDVRVTFEGIIQAYESLYVHPKVAGPIVEFRLEEGQKVHRNEVLGVIDSKSSLDTAILSPMSGVACAINAALGDLVKPNEKPIAVIHQIEPSYVAFSVPEDEFEQIHDAMQIYPIMVEVQTLNTNAMAEEGFLECVNDLCTAQNGGIGMRAVLTNKNATFMPGQVVNVSLVLPLHKLSSQPFKIGREYPVFCAVD